MKNALGKKTYWIKTHWMQNTLDEKCIGKKNILDKKHIGCKTHWMKNTLN